MTKPTSWTTPKIHTVKNPGAKTPPMPMPPEPPKEGEKK